ncbi:hypothetical protein HMPREF9151_01871 [Hoylesella saccharolytica F0055]|uniref:Uncharacterized protein n=1 Tax=Hoylesella saccharolytica F0055 TaxID=1127699 RepID=L1N6B5_9BACT|nr:hypothetical protein HMPREF9151_01871 [Hoylesella saccharolytica F0055]
MYFMKCNERNSVLFYSRCQLHPVKFKNKSISAGFEAVLGG